MCLYYDEISYHSAMIRLYNCVDGIQKAFNIELTCNALRCNSSVIYVTISFKSNLHVVDPGGLPSIQFSGP